VERPQTRYAQIGDDYVAYQMFGAGPDLVFHAGWYSHIGAMWDEPTIARFVERLASFARVIIFDRRGHGMSDPVDLENITLEQWMEDLTAVLRAAGVERAALVGTTETGPMQLLYAATYPERTTGIVLFNATACFARKPDYPIGMPERARIGAADMMRDLLVGGSDHAMAGIGPTRRRSGPGWDAMLRYLRYSTSPGLIHRLMHASMAVDVRHLLPSVHVPTLVLHRRDQPFVHIEHGRYIADRVAGARFVELAGSDLAIWVDSERALEEIEEFVTGVRPVKEPDRVLATVLFTDIVGSTQRASTVGDRRWLEMLERHNGVVREELGRHRGREVSTSGDGFLATFDGPARAARCALAIVNTVGALGMQVRAGVHTGEVEWAGDEVGGVAVHIGRRVSDLAAAGEVLVSRTVVDLVAGSSLTFADRGFHVLKGVPGEWQLFAVEA
jgi:class 3 adenylate cyclase